MGHPKPPNYYFFLFDMTQQFIKPQHLTPSSGLELANPDLKYQGLLPNNFVFKIDHFLKPFLGRAKLILLISMTPSTFGQNGTENEILIKKLDLFISIFFVG